MVESQEMISNIIDSDHNFCLINTDMSICNDTKNNDKNNAATTIPEYDMSNATVSE